MALIYKLQWRPIVLPDCYIDHGSPVDQLSAAGLTPSHIAATVFNLLGQAREELEVMTKEKCKEGKEKKKKKGRKDGVAINIG